MSELEELFIAELQDVYSAENQLLKALPKMVKAAQSAELRDAFEEHLHETEQQAERLKQVFELFNRPTKAKKCQAMAGLVDEAKELISETKGSAAADAALISAAQKVEHYEIASYGTLCTWAKLLNQRQALDLLKSNLAEEENTDKRLTSLANAQANLKASRAMAS